MYDVSDLAGATDWQARNAERFARLDIGRLWAICDTGPQCNPEFEIDLREVLSFYRPGPDRFASMPAKQRNAIYDKLEKSLEKFRDQLASMDDFIEWELDVYGIDLEPDDFDDTIPEEYEGLGFGGYQKHRLLDHLAEFSELVSGARLARARPKGKPKQNTTLEHTISELGRVFTKYSGREPMVGYRYDELDESQPYQGPFLDFLHAIFWQMNGREEPSSHAIGDAARRTFQLRK